MIMKEEELKVILENHKHWINEDCCGWEEMRADLRYADLSNADLRNADLHYVDLRYANLRYANLSNADLHYANLSYADLSYANLSYADLRYANLRYANLSNADLHYANLSYADLSYADLRYADLSNADLRNADLHYVDLRYANLRYADLHYANLSYADLSYADLLNAKNVPFIPYACPDFGMFIAYKKASGYIVELEIPEDAKRLSATTRKCRCDKAKVLRILNYDRTVAYVKEVRSNYDSCFKYKVGEFVSVDNFNEDRWNECSTGIHFFINFQEAVDY